MALDPRIALGVNPQNVQTTFNNTLTNIGKRDAINEQQKLAPLRSQLLQAQVGQAQERQLSERDKSRLTSLGNFASEVLPSLRSDNPQEALSLAKSRLLRMQQTIADNPGIQLDTTETQEFIDLLDTGDGQDQLIATQRAEQAFSLAQRQGLLGQSQTAGQREFNDLLRIAQSPDSTQLEVNAAQRKLGNLAKAGTISKDERIIENKDTVDKIIDFEGAKTGSKETKKLEAQFKLKPVVASAVENALLTARAEAKVGEQRRNNITTLNVYNTAMKSLIDALSNTDTGPFVGFLPAITSNQQIAKGAGAAMLPVLKQVFRSAGEGVFTDKDQELLKDLAPKRTDSEETIVAKLRNIDAIIRAKLTVQSVNPNNQQGVQASLDQTQEFSFDEQGNIIQ